MNISVAEDQCLSSQTDSEKEFFIPQPFTLFRMLIPSRNIPRHTSKMFNKISEHPGVPPGWHTHTNELAGWLFTYNEFLEVKLQGPVCHFLRVMSCFNPFLSIPGDHDKVFYTYPECLLGFPGGSVIKTLCLQFRRLGFNPWVRKMPWRRKWQPSPVFLPGESHGWRSWWARVQWDCRRVHRTERLTLLLFPGSAWTFASH